MNDMLKRSRNHKGAFGDVRPKDEAMEDRVNIIKIICEALSSGDTADASEIARRQYPFLPPPTATRKFTEMQALRVFFRDGFIDRYSGNRLLFPPVLRLLSVMLPDAFPFHRNWKMNKTHPATHCTCINTRKRPFASLVQDPTMY